MASFNTIHIFDNGTIQVIGEKSGIVNLSQVASSTAFIANVKASIPSAKFADYRVIHIFEGNDVKYLASTPMNSISFGGNTSVKIAALDQAKYGAFIAEVIALLPA